MKNPTDDAQKPPKKRPGPVPGLPTKKYTVLLDESVAEWGKRQPGGLSETVRLLLVKAYREAVTQAKD